jgi:hypothetical protein
MPRIDDRTPVILRRRRPTGQSRLQQILTCSDAELGLIRTLTFEIVACLSAGDSRAQTARHVGVSTTTVGRHVRALTRSRAHGAARWDKLIRLPRRSGVATSAG